MNALTSFKTTTATVGAAERRALADAYTGAFDATRGARVIAGDDEAIDVAAAYADEIAEAAAQRDIEAIPPLTELERASDIGLTSLFVPRSHGGPQVRYGTLAEVLRLIAQSNPSVAQILIAQYTLGDVITDRGSDAQKDHFLPLVVRGARIANALTEFGTKSAAEMRTTLTAKPGGGYVLDGEKFYTTGSYVSHWFPVLAREGFDRVAYAFVARNAPGLEILDDWRGVGQRATVSGTARFRKVDVPDVAVIFAGADPAPHSGNTFAQLLHAAVDVGIAGGALAEAARFLNEKARAWPEAGVERASQEPHIIHSFGELKVLESGANALVQRAGCVLDRLRCDKQNQQLQTDAILAVAEARSAADNAALKISTEIFALGGARASLDVWNLDRFWRNARTHTVHDPIRWRHHAIGNYHLNGVAPLDNARSGRRSG